MLLVAALHGPLRPATPINKANRFGPQALFNIAHVPLAAASGLLLARTPVGVLISPMLMRSGQEDVVQFCGGFPVPSVSANIALHIVRELHRLCAFVQNDKLAGCILFRNNLDLHSDLNFIETERRRALC